jgi:hypothetical protein
MAAYYPPLLFSQLKDHEEFVYHYTCADTAAKLILPNRTIKFGTYEGTNDPKEFKQWKFVIGSLPAGAGYIDIDAISEEVSAAIKRCAHVLCCGVDLPTPDSAQGADIQHRGYARPRMWDQYGRKHKGVCLIFRRTRLTELLLAHAGRKGVLAGLVNYQNRGFAPRLDNSEPYLIDYQFLQRVGSSRYALEHIRCHHAALFFEKAVDWRDEREYRWVVANPNSAPIFLHFDNALAGIAFGEDCPEDTLRACVRAARRPGTDFEQLSWKNSAPWVSMRMDWDTL